MAPKKKGKGKKGQQKKKMAPSGGGGDPAVIPAPDRGHLVGLRSRPDLNSHRVEVRGQAPGPDGAPRFAVRLLFGAEAGTVLKVKAANLDLDRDRVMDDPAMATLVAEMQALAPGVAPEEERRDWESLPEVVLLDVLERVEANAFGEVARISPRGDWLHEEGELKRYASRHTVLLPVALTCKPWRKAQQKLAQLKDDASGPQYEWTAEKKVFEGPRAGEELEKFQKKNKIQTYTYSSCGNTKSIEYRAKGPRKPAILRTRATDLVASSGGSVELVEWALGAGCPATWSRRYGGAASLAEVAARLGYSALVQWLFRKKHCPVNTEVMRGAVIAGNFQLVKWCKARGKVSEWGAAVDERARNSSWAPGSEKWTVCSEAATHGHLEILRWAHKKGCPLGDSARAAARTGSVACLEYAGFNGCALDYPVIGAAAGADGGGGHVETLKFIQLFVSECGFSLHFDALNELGEDHGKSLKRVLCDAIRGGPDVEIVRILHEEIGIPVDAHMLAGAVVSRYEDNEIMNEAHFEVAKYLLNTAGCKWTKFARWNTECGERPACWAERGHEVTWDPAKFEASYDSSDMGDLDHHYRFVEDGEKALPSWWEDFTVAPGAGTRIVGMWPVYNFKFYYDN